MLSNAAQSDPRVFISSRMAELNRDRAVVYQALVAHRWHPVLFEREPDSEDAPKIDRMLEQCPRMVGLYYLTLGSATSLYKPLAAIEYELLGHLAKQNGVPLKEMRSRLTKDDPKKVADEFIAGAAASQSLSLFLKAQRGFDSLRARKRHEIPPTIEEVLSTYHLKDSLVAHILQHEAVRNRVCVYHSTETLFQHILDRFSHRQGRRVETMTFQFSLQGPDYVGLLNILCQMLFERGLNIDWIHQTAATGVFLVALTVSTGHAAPDVDDLVHKLVKSVSDEYKEDGANKVWKFRGEHGSLGDYDFTIRRPESRPERPRARLDIAASDTPGILATITNVLASAGLNIEELSLVPEEYLGAPQSHVRVTASYPSESFGRDPDAWAKLHNALVSTIGVYGAAIRQWVGKQDHRD